MTQFSTLIQQKLERGEYQENTVEVFVKNPGGLDFMIAPPSRKEACYHLQGSYHGTKNTLPETASSHCAHLLDSLEMGPENWSDLRVSLQDQESLEISHYVVSGNLNLYHFNLIFPEAKRPRHIYSCLSSVADLFYGLAIDPDQEISELFDREKDNLPQGILVSVRDRMKYGTIPERKARRIIRYQFLKPGEKEVLKTYDPALVRFMPETRELSADLLQKRPAGPAKRFVSLFEQPPRKVEGISLLVEGSKGVCVSASYHTKKSPKPEVSVSFCSPELQKVYQAADLLWDGYHSLTGLSIERALSRKIK